MLRAGGPCRPQGGLLRMVPALSIEGATEVCQADKEGGCFPSREPGTHEPRGDAAECAQRSLAGKELSAEAGVTRCVGAPGAVGPRAGGPGRGDGCLSASGINVLQATLGFGGN